jgi:3-dehydroquinate synthase
MKPVELRVALGERSYPIKIGCGTLEGIGGEMRKLRLGPKIAIISNPTVYKLYGERVLKSIKKAGFKAAKVIIPDGEQYKDFLRVYYILGELLKERLDRSSALVALGGGVIGDITGFAASIYMRGIPFIQAPTTLLAQVDSSVGGKTGVNHPLGKNMIGTFWQPRLVWIDTDTLKTLPRREFLSGMAEVIKYGVIWDEGFFRFLEENQKEILSLEKDALIHIIERSCGIKAEVVSRDEREGGLRAILNYGHTVGHAVETVTGYGRYLHGEAVSIGMHLEARLSGMLSLIKKNEVKRIKGLVESYGLPSALPAGLDAGRMLDAMAIDKKAVAGELKFILPEKIGSVRIEKVLDCALIESALSI